MSSDVALGELFRIGSSKRVLKAQWQKEGVPFYRGREVTCLSRDGYVNNELFISEELYSEFSEKYGVPSSGDIVITAIGTIGNSYIVREGDRFYFKDASVLWLKKTADVNTEFINLWLKSPLLRNQLDKGNGATVDTLTIKKLQSVVVNLPPIKEQKRIVAILDEAFAGISQAVANAEKNLANARELFENYLNNVFTQKGEGWVETILDELGKITSSKRIYKREYTNSGIPFFRTKEIKEKANGRNITTELFISEDRYAEIKGKFGAPQEGDILLTAIGTIGEIYVVDGSENFYFKDGNVLWLKEFKTVNPYFLRYVLMSFVENLKRLSHGAAYNALPIEKLKNHIVYLPSTDEQKNVVSKLDALKEKANTLEGIYLKKLSALTELKQSILQKAFSGELTSGTDKQFLESA